MGVHLLWTTVSGNSRLQLSTVDAHPLLSPVVVKRNTLVQLELPVVKQPFRPFYNRVSSCTNPSSPRAAIVSLPQRKA